MTDKSGKPDNLDLQPAHWHIVQSILRRHVPQYAVWAFGSRTTGSARCYSDLDLAVVADRPLSLDTSAILKGAFSESDLP